MTARKTKTTRPARTAEPKHKPAIFMQKGETATDATTRSVVAPALRHGELAQSLTEAFTAGLPDDTRPELGHYVCEFDKRATSAGAGDLMLARQLLAAQAMTLDGIFTEMARRSALNMGQHMDATERYMRLALKAQAGSRATVEALARMHQPREQTVRHVHVNEGGQAVIADEFHHHAGGQREYGKADEQPHATGPGAAGTCAPLPSPDPIGDAVPVPSGEGKATVQDARRQRQRRT